MGCTTSHDAFAAAVTSSSSRARARRASASGGDPAALCRERVALIRAAADSRYALTAAHAAYFRSLAAVGDALRRFAASALAPATPESSSPPVAAATASASVPPSPSSSSSTVSPLSHSLSDDDLHLHDLDDTRHGGGGGGSEEASTRYHHHFMRRSSTVPTVVYEDPDAQTQYTTAEASYGYAYGDGYGHAYGNGYGHSYGPAYPYGPYGEVIAGETPEAAPRHPGPPPSPPTAEASPWEFLDPFAQYDQFMEDYAAGNQPTNSPNYAELRRMEGIPELEDEAELERKAEKSKPSTSGVSDQDIKGKGPIQDNAASNDDFFGDSKLQKNATSKGDSPGGKLHRDATSISDSSGGKLQRKGSEPPPDGKLQRKGSEPAADAEGEGGKPVSRNDSVPSNASSKSKEERKKNTVSLKGTVSSGTDGSSTSGKKKGVAFEAEQSIRAAEGGGESHGKSIQSVVSSEPFSPLHHGTRDVREAIGEVKELFDEAANCSTDVSRLLEVGKMPPRDTPRVLRYISSRVIDPLGLTVSTSSCLRKSHGMKSRASSSKANTSASSGAGRSNGIGHLSSTLEKLWFWEKKLYQEIKDEEKLRMKYEKYYRRLKSMDDRGAESSTIHSVQLSVRHLKSKISINMSTAKAFSLKIQQIRDEELYPQLVDLIQRFRRLWKAVLECHEKQLLAIQDSRIHRLKAMTVSQSGAEASRDLERELTKWYRCFNKWVSSQRSCAEALNEWLKKWLPEVQEEVTADGPPPFSPGRILAPPVFIISNDWFQAIEMVSKNDVLRAIDQFSKVVHEFKKSQEDEQRQKRKADHASKDYNRKCKDLEIELGLSTMENPRYSHDNRVMDLEKLRKRRDVESTRHDKTLSHAHVAASATLPIGLVPVLQQITSFFQRNQRVYMEIRIQGA
ncbi:unnamed protein product [Miscanthus lutarioriparius]|uniref:Uncharacterized protein n=1 Tax=Miscanthus lutarioriparius TaxID=422564 RepID=A0A811NPJ4_9POAL|nr:unnamed protein product [Miscanthus lutarioriparius]